MWISFRHPPCRSSVVGAGGVKLVGGGLCAHPRQSRAPPPPSNNLTLLLPPPPPGPPLFPLPKAWKTRTSGPPVFAGAKASEPSTLRPGQSRAADAPGPPLPSSETRHPLLLPVVPVPRPLPAQRFSAFPSDA